MILQGSRAYFSLCTENVNTWEGFSWTCAPGALINWEFTGLAHSQDGSGLSPQKGPDL